MSTRYRIFDLQSGVADFLQPVINAVDPSIPNLPLESPAPQSMTAPLGTLTLTGLVPTIVQSSGSNQSMTAVLGTLTLTGLVPVFNQSTGFTAPLGTLTLTGLTPTFDQTGLNTFTATLGVLTLNGLVPTFDQSGAVAAVTSSVGGVGRRYHKEYVEIDGEYFPVESQQEAIEILKRLQDVAEEEAPKAAKAVKTAVKPVEPQITLSPGLDDSGLRRILAQTQAYISGLYEQAQRTQRERVRIEQEQDRIRREREAEQVALRAAIQAKRDAEQAIIDAKIAAEDAEILAAVGEYETHLIKRLLH